MYGLQFNDFKATRQNKPYCEQSIGKAYQKNKKKLVKAIWVNVNLDSHV